MSAISVGNIRYNPSTSAYEARVDINREGRTFRYPCSVTGTLMADEFDVRKRLTKQALTMAGREGGLHAAL